MTLTLKKILIHTPLALLLFTGVSATAVGGGFYTIIGPDGHPMVVPQGIPQKKQQQTQVITVSESVQKQSIQTQPEKQQSPEVKKLKNQQIIQKVTKTELQAISTPLNPPIKTHLDITQNVPVTHPVRNVEVPTASNTTKMLTNQVEIQASVNQNNVLADQTSLKQQPMINETKAANEKQKDENFVEIDGVKYVNNEYLEEREFNLEGKKRFYMTPEVGTMARGHIETVQREKGIGQTLVEKIQKQKHEVVKTIALSPTYYRLPKTEVIESLQKACFTDKKVQKAKTLDLKNKDVGFWPVSPIKEDFAYEVVKLDPQVDNILLTSYASSQKSPSYYWPLVVFLDQKGCVVEGVSGFKNQNLGENNMQYAAMEGILKKPKTASYMFMTPLSAAVDAENMQLTNQGQIKLSVIR